MNIGVLETYLQAFWPEVESSYFPANISTSDQRCFNVVDQRWNNVDPTLKLKQNPKWFFQRCTTLIQRCINIVSTQPQCCENCIETNHSIEYGFVNRLIIFILVNVFYNMLLTELLTVVHVVIDIGNKCCIRGNLKDCNFKT